MCKIDILDLSARVDKAYSMVCCRNTTGMHGSLQGIASSSAIGCIEAYELENDASELLSDKL